MHYACLNGHLNITKYLITEDKCDPYCTTNRGLIPLHCACQNGHLEVVKYLITEHKCSPEYGDVDGYTPLHSATSTGHLAIVKYLISQHNCNPQCCDIKGITALHVACFNGHLHVAKYLIQEQNCPCDPKSRIDATTLKELGFTQQMLRIFEPFLLCKDIIPLHCASLGGHLDIVKYLIEVCNCNPNYATSTGLTAIDFAQQFEHQEVVSYLRNEHQCSKNLGHLLASAISHLNGINLDHLFEETNDMFIPPLFYACLTGNLEEVRSHTIESNFDPSSTFILNTTPLQLACTFGHLEIAKYLITEHNCSPEQGDVFGSTPLHCAAFGGHLTIVNNLITHCNCNPQCCDINGNTPLHAACSGGHLHVVKYLICEQKCPCEPEARISNKIKYFLPQIFEQVETELRVFNGITPLHVASEEGHLDIVKYLIDVCNCNPNYCTSNGLTAIDFVMKGGHQEVVTYFRNEYKCSSGCTQVICSVVSHFSSTILGLNSDTICIDDNDICISQLQRACFTGNLAAVKHCATKSDFSSSAAYLTGLTPLNIAILK